MFHWARVYLIIIYKMGDIVIVFYTKTQTQLRQMRRNLTNSFKDTNVLFCFCFLSNTPWLTFRCVKFYLSLVISHELFHSEIKSDAETDLVRQVKTTQKEHKATL